MIHFVVVLLTREIEIKITVRDHYTSKLKRPAMPKVCKDVGQY